MKKALFVFLLLLFFIQYSFMGVLSSSHVWGIDLLVAFLVSIWLKEKSASTLAWAFAVGFLVDYFSSMNLGTYVVIFIFLAIMVEIYKTKFAQSQKKNIMVFISMFLGIIFVDLLLFMFMRSEMFFGRNIDNVVFEGVNPFHYLLAKLLMSCLGLAVYKIVDLIYDLAGRNSLELKISAK